VNSPETESACPTQWKQAKKAREELIGLTGGDRGAAARRAARAVMAQAECEQSRFTAWRIEAGSQNIMAAELRGVRRQYLSTRTLYEEAAGYGDPRIAIGAWARMADLHLGFARKLDALPTPVDIHDAGGRADYRREMRQLMSTFEVEAAVAATRALDAAGNRSPAETTEPAPGGDAGSGELAAWVSRSCDKLAVLDPESVAGYPACAGAGDSPGDSQ